MVAPDWVLTAAHCVVNGVNSVGYNRTDFHTHQLISIRREAATLVNGLAAIYKHPEYETITEEHDVALIRLQKGFDISPNIQVVALPTMPRVAGKVGQLANFSHTENLPSGKVAVYKAPIPDDPSPLEFEISASNAHASLCPGDSGSGLNTIENGRIVVRGIASKGTESDCLRPYGIAFFTDVFGNLPWILDTLKKNNVELENSTTLKFSGGLVDGTMGLACTNPYGNMWAPTNVAGVELGATCEDGFQGIVCKVDDNQSGPTIKQIIGFSVTTTSATGQKSVKQLPFSPKLATFHKRLPVGFKREFVCKFGAPNTSSLPE